MGESYQRFRCVSESSGTWAVWDHELGAAASLGGCLLKGRSEESARAACDILRRIYLNRLDAFAVRQEAKPGGAVTRNRRAPGLRRVHASPSARN